MSRDICEICKRHFIRTGNNQKICGRELCRKKRNYLLGKKRFKSHHEYLLLHHRKSYQKHRTARLAYQRKYSLENKQAISIYNKIRYAKRKKRND